jgi:outer membrane protein TolC
MSGENIKKQGPTCACGKVDLYEDWLKQNEPKEKEGISDSTGSNQAEVNISSADDTRSEAQNPKQSKK